MQTYAQQHMAKYPPRPQVTREILLQAGAEVEKELNQWANWHGKCAGLAQALARIPGAQHLNGYELAKELERSCVLFDIDTAAVEVLDNFSYEVQQRMTELQRQWERAHQVQPPHPIGTQLKEGRVTGISPYAPATYHVDWGRGESRLLVRYEDAITAEEHHIVTASKPQPLALTC
ncbi:hypothetical protein [Comamonas kerstersii]